MICEKNVCVLVLVSRMVFNEKQQQQLINWFNWWLMIDVCVSRKCSKVYRIIITNWQNYQKSYQKIDYANKTCWSARQIYSKQSVIYCIFCICILYRYLYLYLYLYYVLCIKFTQIAMHPSTGNIYIFVKY